MLVILMLGLLGLLGQADATPQPKLDARDSSLNGWTLRPMLEQFLGLDKQQQALPPDNICGYLYGETDNPIDCSPGVCGYNTNLDIFMCCSSTTISGGTTYPIGCPTYTACMAYSTSNTCVDTAICSSADMTICDSDYPYCAAATIAGVPGLSLTDWACLDVKTTVPVYLSAVSGASGASSVQSSAAASTAIISGVPSGSFFSDQSSPSPSPTASPDVVSKTVVVTTTPTKTTTTSPVEITSPTTLTGGKTATSLPATQSIVTNGAGFKSSRLDHVLLGLLGAVLGLLW